MTKPRAPRGSSSLALPLLWLASVVLLLLLAALDMRLGSRLIGWNDIIAFPTRPDTLVQAILETSRAPRVVAAILTGAALAAAGSVLQSVLRNPLAAPDILSVTSGAQLMLVISTLLLPVAVPSIIATTGGGLTGALACIALAGGFRAPPGRLALAGVAISLCFAALSSAIVLLADDRASGLILWSSGILDQTGWSKIVVAAPVILLSCLVLMTIARPLDLLGLGDQVSASLGLTRALTLSGIFAGVLLSGAAVTLAGPIGFIGLAIPNILRALGITRHRHHLPLALILGANTLLFADVVVQFFAGNGSIIPTGVVVACFGAPVMLFLLRTTRIGSERRIGTPSALHRPSLPLLIGLLAAIALIGSGGALMIGDSVSLSIADIAANLDIRAPRLLVALACGALLATAGTVLQAVTRNPLCGPETLGLAQAAALFSLVGLLSGFVPGTFLFQCVTLGGAFAAIFLLRLFGPKNSPDRLILAGVAIAASCGAAGTIIVVEARLQTAEALSWLAGSTHGRGYADALSLMPWLAFLITVGIVCSRHLDTLALGDDTARSLGLPTDKARRWAIFYAACAVGVAVSSIGAVSFVGLLSPHAARLLAGPRHARCLPVAMVVGGVLMVFADLIGRSIIAPLELPAGIVTAVIGAPIFLILLRPRALRAVST
ncbi:iron ABC transporter permease [Agrobacterium tumefaciens]|uniref:iron ABC transporter permease n=1 Tax=Agrobacterium tumefaciens TaxID=358 RepID=UPI0021D3149D|nr:iron ABC transporter permease [Agrobacterium tumefaciens]UXS04124.1 iron ABC transporter permease [Agrobacterium tumefaciens]